MAKKKGKKCGGLVHKMNYKKGGSVKKKGYAQGGYIKGPDGTPVWTDDISTASPDTIMNPEEMKAAGVAESYGLQTAANNQPGALDKVGGMVAGNVAGNLLLGPLGGLIGGHIGGRRGITGITKALKRGKDKIKDDWTEDKEEEEKEASTPLNEIEGSTALAQQTEDRFLKRKEDEPIADSDGDGIPDDEEGPGGHSGKDSKTNKKVSDIVSQIPGLNQFQNIVGDIQGQIAGDGSSKGRQALADSLTPHKTWIDQYDKLRSGNATGKDYLGAAGTVISGGSPVAAFQKSFLGLKDGGKVKEGYHKMPDGSIMKDSEHKGMAHGGKVIGKGTAKSDSIKASLEEGSFVVPAENAHIAEKIREEVFGNGGKVAKYNKGGKVDVKISNKEHIFSPKEAQHLTKIGINLNALAPNAEAGNEYKDGSWVTVGRGSSSIEVWDTGDPTAIRYPKKDMNKMSKDELDYWKKAEKNRVESNYSLNASDKEKALRAVEKIQYNLGSVMEEEKQKVLKSTAKEEISKKTTALSETISPAKDTEVGAITPEANEEIKKSLDTPLAKEAKEQAKAAAKYTGETPYQTWTEMTSRPWSEAAASGYSDGTAKSNLALQKALKSGTVDGKGTYTGTPLVDAIDSNGKSTTVTKKPDAKIAEVSRDEATLEELADKGPGDSAVVSGSALMDAEASAEADMVASQEASDKAARRENRKERAGRTAGNVGKFAMNNAGTILGVYQALRAEKELRNLGAEPEIGTDPALLALNNKLGDETSFGFDSGQTTALRNQLDLGVRGAYEGIEAQGGSRGSQRANKMLARLKANKGAENIASTSAGLRNQKLGMLGGVANALQNVRTRRDAERLASRRALETALGGMQAAGTQNVVNNQQFNRVMSEREKRLAYTNQATSSEELGFGQDSSGNYTYGG